MKRLIRRTAVITGAAGGLGRALSLALGREGCSLALVDTNQVGLEQSAALLRAEGRNVSTHCVDVSDREAMRRLPEEVVSRHGQIELLVNNAGVTTVASFEDHRMEDFDRVLGVNLMGVLHGCKFFLPYLRLADEAHIVNVSSVFGLFGMRQQAAYSMSKFGVVGLSETLWSELHESTIGVSCVMPGGLRTHIAEHAAFFDAQLRAQAVRFFAENALSPDRAADRIVNGIRHKQRRILITREAYVIDAVRRIFPSRGAIWLSDLVEHQLRRAALLFEPVRPAEGAERPPRRPIAL